MKLYAVFIYPKNPKINYAILLNIIYKYGHVDMHTTIISSQKNTHASIHIP